MAACLHLKKIPTVYEIKIYKRYEVEQKLTKINIPRIAHEGKVAVECSGTNESICFNVLSKFNGPSFPNVEVLYQRKSLWLNCLFLV